MNYNILPWFRAFSLLLIIISAILLQSCKKEHEIQPVDPPITPPIEMSWEDARALSLGGLERTTLWSRYSETEKTAIRTTQTKYGTKSLDPSVRMGHYCN